MHRFRREIKQATLDNSEDDLESTSVHPRSTDQLHVPSWTTLGDDVTRSLKRAYPKKNKSSYDQVHVLLLNWEADDLDTHKEVDDLRQLFEETYFFHVQPWGIPSNGSSNKLELRIAQFKESYDTPSNLLIVYYGGHGARNRENRSIWVANEKDDSPYLDWSDIQPSLIRAESDVLLLLDCCYAATAATRGRPGQKEVLAACSVESVTTGVSDNSFTRNLIEEMKLLSGAEFNVTTLHSRLMERRGLDRLHYTPIHASLSNNMKPSIVLTPFDPPPQYEADSKFKSPAIKDESTNKLAIVKSASATFTEQLHNADTRVMICARLKASDNLPSADDWLSYLVDGAPEEIEEMAITLERDVQGNQNSLSVVTQVSDSQSLDFFDANTGLPSAASSVVGSVANRKTRIKRLMRPFRQLFVKSENSFSSHSTLLLVSVPIPIWDFLPENPAYSFVGFIRSNDPKAALDLPRRWSAKSTVRTNSPLLERIMDTENRHWWWRWCLLVLFVSMSIWLLRMMTGT